MNLGISGRLALVVGASSGIGSEIGRELWAEGCTVISVSRTMQDIEHGRLISIRRDLMPETAPMEFGGEILIKYGCPDIIIHVIGGSQGITNTMVPWSDWEKVMRLNVGIAHDINRAFIANMTQNRWGRIIHITSNAASGAVGYCPYATAKAALNGYIKSVSKEYSVNGVVIAGISPGIVHTPGRYFASLDDRQQEEYFNKYIPIHRFARAEEIAKTVAYLCSEHAAYMAGSIVSIDGGAR